MVVLALGVLLAGPGLAHADDDPCDMLPMGPAKSYCEREPGDKGPSDGGGGSLTPGVDSTLDPVGALADSIGKGAAWVVTQLSNAVTATSDVDFTNQNFLQTYALVFAASTFLVLLIWLWAVAKRAIRGVPLTTAIGEAIGLLWLTVLASAFTPLILYAVVGAVDGVTEALAGGGDSRFFDSFSKALTSKDNEGGPFVRIVLSFVAMIAAGTVWLELVIRTALLYVGAALGTVVYAGLVDKQLWGRVKKWAGIMAAIILVKPIIVIVLRLASAMTEGEGPQDDTAAIISGLSITIIAIIASAMLYRMIPGMGDEIVAARRDSYDPASRQSSAIFTRPAASISQGINTHAARDSVSRTATASVGASSSGGGAGGGMSAHASRTPRAPRPEMPRQDERDKT